MKNRVRGAILAAGLSLACVFILETTGGATPQKMAPTTLTIPTTAFQGNIALTPPPSGFTPTVSASAADAAALARAGQGVQSVQPQLATFSWDAAPVDANDVVTGAPLYTDVPVWVVHLIGGVCGVMNPSNGDCLSNTYNFVVDASSGQVIIGYADES